MTPESLLLAFGFANLAILGWLAAAAAPLLIHLWMKRTQKETPWAAIRFLKAALERHAKRLQLQQWILLAIRTAILLLIVLAASKPFLDAVGLGGGAGRRTHRLLVFDTSLSMRYQAEGRTLLAEAVQLASRVVENASPGDSFTVITMGPTPRALLRQPTTDRNQVRQRLASVEATDGSAALAPTLSLIEEMLAEVRTTDESLDGYEVLLFSDMQKSTWQTLADQKSPLRLMLEGIGQTARLSLTDVGRPESSNQTVTSLEVVESSPTLQSPVSLRASLQRFGPGPDGDAATAELLVNDLSTASQTVRFDPSGKATIEFRHRFDRAGQLAIAVQLSGDALAADDTRWLGLSMAETIRVLCVAGGPGAARYVAQALSPGTDESGPLQTSVISDAQLATTPLDDFDCIFVCNVPQFSGEESSRLRNYVSRGGGVVFFLGDRVLPDRYNESLGIPNNGLLLNGVPQASTTGSPFRLVVDSSPAASVSGPAGDASPLFNFSIAKPVTRSNYGLDPLDYQHPIIAVFRGQERAGLLTTPVSRYYQLQLPGEGNEQASTPQVALATADGDPLIVTSAFGRGRAVLVTTAGSLASIDPTTGQPWTAMPAWPSFLPIVRELANYASGDAASQNVEVGQPISGSLPVALAQRELQITLPDGRQETIVLADEDQDWSFKQTSQAGLYQVRAEAGSAGGDEPFALATANTPTLESDLSRVSLKSLPDLFLLRQKPGDTTSMASEILEQSSFHQWLLMAALVLVLLETYLAYRFGRPVV